MNKLCDLSRSPHIRSIDNVQTHFGTNRWKWYFEPSAAPRYRAGKRSTFDASALPCRRFDGCVFFGECASRGWAPKGITGGRAKGNRWRLSAGACGRNSIWFEMHHNFWQARLWPHWRGGKKVARWFNRHWHTWATRYKPAIPRERNGGSRSYFEQTTTPYSREISEEDYRAGTTLLLTVKGIFSFIWLLWLESRCQPWWWAIFRRFASNRWSESPLLHRRVGFYNWGACKALPTL